MERVDTRAVRTTANITSLQQGHKLRDEEKGSEENKQFDPGGKGEKAPLWNAAVTSISLFLWRALGHGGLVACASCYLFRINPPGESTAAAIPSFPLSKQPLTLLPFSILQ